MYLYGKCIYCSLPWDSLTNCAESFGVNLKFNGKTLKDFIQFTFFKKNYSSNFIANWLEKKEKDGSGEKDNLQDVYEVQFHYQLIFFSLFPKICLFIILIF
jgi:hypothetical protein